ncbi:MAG TPA: hypothetical protein VF188_01945 [Longimicrobiales bacterium]
MTVVQAGGTRPTAAIDARNGTLYVAWVGTDTAGANVYLARLEPGGTAFSAPVRVNDVPGDAAPHEQAPAQVAVGPEGNVYVAWQNNTVVPGRRFPASDLRFARSVDGGRTFEPAIYVNDDAGGTPTSHTFHNLLVGPDGTVYVAWIDSRTRASEMAATGGAGQGTKASSMASMGHHGESAGPGPEIRFARSTDQGRSFGPSVVVDRDACPCCRTSLALGADGTVYVAWRKVFDGNLRDIVVARMEPGAAGFEAPVRVHADEWFFEACPHAGPSIAVDAAGRLHVGWYTGREGGPGLYHAVSTDGGRSFGTPDAVLADAWVPPSQITLAADETGAVWVAWDDRRAVERTVHLARVPAGESDPVDVDAALAGRAPSVAAAAAVRAVTWLDGAAVRVALAR